MAEVIASMTRRTPRGDRPARLAAAAALAAALVQTGAALGNLRAPRTVAASPSASLAAPSVPLTVDRELLTFLCGAESCLVTAQYDLTSTSAARVRLEMILPVRNDVTATTNADPASVVVAPAEPLTAAEARALEPGSPGAPPLFRAAFESALRAGRNAVAVRYSQPLAAEETDYGLVKKRGRMVQRFRYELWPLGEWTRSAGFRVKLAVAIERPAPSWFARRFGHPRSIACLTSDTTAPVPPGRLEQRGGRLWYEAELGPSFPDRITCFVGDDDLMPRY